MRWRSFVAVGDSFTEGMDDAYPDGTYRGWADLVATRLAAEAGPDFRYANLAIRGRLFPSVVAEQVPVGGRDEARPDQLRGRRQRRAAPHLRPGHAGHPLRRGGPAAALRAAPTCSSSGSPT